MKKHYLFLSCVLCLSFIGIAQPTARIVKDGLFIPWEIVWGQDDNIWFTQKNGYICRLNPVTSVLDTLYHETATVIQNEGGMLGMALHPQFPATPYVYVAYDYLAGTSYRERVVRYTYNGSNALSAPTTLLDNINASSIHNGCRLLIVLDKLFITTGDANNTSNSQNLLSPNGKIHRINLDGSVPSDNPIPGSSVWSWGHRNAQGMVYANGLLYSSEHGPGSDDELHIIRKGRNYGWPIVQGFCNTPAEIQFCNDSNVVQPMIAWTPTLAVCGLDYYNNSLFPAWQGSLLMTTLKNQRLYSLKLNAAKDSVVAVDTIKVVSFGRLRDVCVSPSGRIYVSTSNSSASGSGAKVDRIVEVYNPLVTGVPGVTSPDLGIVIHPNPVTAFVEGTYAGGAGSYQITGLDGKLVQQGSITNGRFRIATEQFPAGVYQLQIIERGTAKKGVSQFVRK